MPIVSFTTTLTVPNQPLQTYIAGNIPVEIDTLDFSAVDGLSISCGNPTLFIDQNNLYAVLLTQLTFGAHFAITITKSTDGGKTFTAQQTITEVTIGIDSFYDPQVRSIYITYTPRGTSQHVVQVYDCTSDTLGLLTADAGLTGIGGGNVSVSHIGNTQNSGIFLFYASNTIGGANAGIAGIQYSTGAWGTQFTVVDHGAFNAGTNFTQLYGQSKDPANLLHLVYRWSTGVSNAEKLQHVTCDSSQTPGADSTVDTVGLSNGDTSVTVLTDAVNVYVLYNPCSFLAQQQPRMGFMALGGGGWTATLAGPLYSAATQLLEGSSACFDAAGHPVMFWIYQDSSVSPANQSILQNTFTAGIWGSPTTFYSANANPPANWDNTQAVSDLHSVSSVSVSAMCRRNITCRRIAPHAWQGNNRVIYNRIEFEMARGQGNNLVTDPVMTLSWANDGGSAAPADGGPGQSGDPAFNNGIDLPTGERGQYKQRVYANRCGYARDRIFQVVYTDPVYKGIVGAELDLIVCDS